jgi:proton glutamate symport protein
MAQNSKLHRWIIIGMIIGFVFGLLLNIYQSAINPVIMDNILWYTKLLGKDLFIGSLKMIIAPLILASIINGICSLPSSSQLGDIGIKTLLYYITTTAVAVSIGLIAVFIISPGTKESSIKIRESRIREINIAKTKYQQEGPETSFESFLAQESGADAGEANSKKWSTLNKGATRSPGEMLRQDILLKILKNPFDSLANTNSLGIIVFSILVGLACLIIGKPAAGVAQFFSSLNLVMNTITMWVMKLSPVAIGCLITNMIATQGLPALQSLSWYCVTVIVGIFIHIIFLLVIVKVFGKMGPITFLKGMREAWLIAFSTTSSAATLPVTIRNVEENLGVDKKVSNFALPVGATCNMDGTALYEGVAVIFMIQVFGGLADVPIILTPVKTLIIFITAVLASVGAAAVPSAGLITMAIVAKAVGLPLYYIPILYAVDHLLDQFRTSTNVLGDAAGTVIVDRLRSK